MAGSHIKHKNEERAEMKRELFRAAYEEGYGSGFIYDYVLRHGVTKPPMTWSEKHPFAGRFVWHLPGLLIGLALFVLNFALGGGIAGAMALLAIGYVVATIISHLVRLLTICRTGKGANHKGKGK